MKKNKTATKIAIPPWILIGSVAVLLPLFAFLTYANLQRHQERNIQLLVEKGAALIRAFEAGTRTGSMLQPFDRRHLQQLLTETARQPDIRYLAVVNREGLILAHSNPSRIGYGFATDLDIARLSHSAAVHWRVVAPPASGKVFEVFQRFSPMGNQWPASNLLSLFKQLCRPYMADWQTVTPSDLILFIGLDMQTLEAAQHNDIRQALIIAGVMLLIGLTGFVLLFVIHNYQATRRSLSRAQAFSDILVEHIPIGLIVIDPDKRLASYNQVAESFFTPLTESSIGKDIAEILPRELWKRIEDPCILEGVVDAEIKCPVKEGRLLPFEVSATLLRDNTDRFLGYILLFKDLSEIQSLKKNLARNQRLAAIGRLAAGVAHEIRNPLSSIKGFATYFKERYNNHTQDRQIAQIMIQEVDRLNRVVSHLLEFARPITVKGRPADLAVLVHDSLKLIEAKANQKGIQVTVSPAPPMEPKIIDSDKINQVLLNLYLNALDAMPDGGRLTIGYSPHAWKKGIEISVADTGTGITAKDLPHLFDPYFTRKPGGTGIGLAIVQKIVEAHQGEIQVTSHPGQGTIFTLFLGELTETRTTEP